MQSDRVVETENLVKKFGSQVAVGGISLSVNRGDVYGFLGLNGAGKTTSLRLLMGLLKPDSGTIRLFGSENEKERRQNMHRVGAMVESPSFYRHLSGRRNLQLLGALGARVSNERVDQVLDIVGLKDAGNKKARHYSLGMKQRLAIGLALLGKPDLVVLDEPANGLDPNGIIEMRHLIRRLNEEEGTTFVVSSHLLYEIELMCNRILILEKGKKLFEGPPEEFGRQGTPRFLAKGPSEEALCRTLASLDACAEVVQAPEGGVHFASDFANLPQIHRELAEAGIELHTLEEERMTLEEFFLEQSNTRHEGQLT